MEHRQHIPYALGLLDNDELAPDHIRTHVEIDYAPGPMPLHSHMFFELAYVRRCVDTEYAIGADTYRLQPGDVLLIPPGVLHGIVTPEWAGEVCVREVIWISRQFLNRMNQMRPDVWFYKTGDIQLFRTAESRWADLGELFAKGVQEHRLRQFGWEVVVLGNTMVLLSRLGRAMLDRSVLVMKEERCELLLRVLDYLETNLSEKLTLELMAARFDVSKSTLTQLFRKRLDISFYAYLTKRRLITAKGLIARGMPLEQVGKQVGYKEHSAFYRAFKQEYGISPREYRTICEENGTLVTAHK